jgi:hypothetical protein
MIEFSATESAAANPPAQDCRVVVLYETSLSHEQAMEVCQRLRAEAGGAMTWGIQCWKFSQLADGVQFRQSASVAAEADIVLLATHGGHLPFAVREWLGACEGQRTKPDGALSVIFAKPISRASAIGAVLWELQTAARRMAMDFLPLIPPATRHAIETLEHRERMSAALAGVALQPHSTHYGLDD